MEMIKMIEQSAQTLSFAAAAAESTAVLKAKKLYSGLRVSFFMTDSGATTVRQPLAYVDKLVIDAPEYGNNSRRIDVADATVATLPLACQLGAMSTDDAASATSVFSTVPISTTSAGSGTTSSVGGSNVYFDIPINKKSLEEDLRVTIKMTCGTNRACTVSFAFLDYPMRSVFFRAYDLTSVSGSQQWFPADGILRGVSVAGHGTSVWNTAASAAGSAFAYVARSDDVTKISLNGEQTTTYSNPNVLAGGLDEIVNGGPAGSAQTWAQYDSYGMFKNFPAQVGAQYVQIDATAGTESYMILGVMSDA